jgi:hypothetical protein
MLYLVKSGDYLKIGYTDNVYKRIRQYNTYNPDIEVLSIRFGNEEDEKKLHELLSEYNYKLEWFHYNNEVIDTFINYQCDSINANFDLADLYMVLKSIKGVTDPVKFDKIVIPTIDKYTLFDLDNYMSNTDIEILLIFRGTLLQYLKQLGEDDKNIRKLNWKYDITIVD